MSELARRVVRAARWLAEVYALDLDLDPAEFVISCGEASRFLPPGAVPRTGILIRQDAEALCVGLYVHPEDAADAGTILEETSHLLCLAWHAARSRPVSALALEIQGEVDRFLYARVCGRDPLAHFERFRWAEWLAADQRQRYQTAHRVAGRYCRRLDRRYPHAHDTPALLAELRGFYRRSPQGKIEVGQAA